MDLIYFYKNIICLGKKTAFIIANESYTEIICMEYSKPTYQKFCLSNLYHTGYKVETMSQLTEHQGKP